MPIPGADHAAQIRRPDAILPSARKVRPKEVPFDFPGDIAVAVSESQGFLVAAASTIWPLPARVDVMHCDPAQSLESHRTPPLRLLSLDMFQWSRTERYCTLV